MRTLKSIVAGSLGKTPELKIPAKSAQVCPGLTHCCHTLGDAHSSLAPAMNENYQYL